MSQSTRAQLETLRDSLVISGGKQTTAANLRAMYSAIIESLLNILDDKDADDGYLGIDGDGLVDVSKIAQLTPEGKFLKDNGTWNHAKLQYTGVTLSQALEPNIEFQADAGSLLTFTLPPAAQKGDKFIVNGFGAGGWRISQNVGQTIHGATDSTTGATGFIASATRYDCVELVCVQDNLEFVIRNQRGNITIT